MATKRGDKSRYELVNLGYSQRKEDEFIERIVLPTDSLQGIALLYNTSIAELRKVNNLHTEKDLHARRIIKVPAKGILVDLTEEAAVPVPTTSVDGEVEIDSDEESSNGQIYLDNVDSVLKGIREKAEAAAANSEVFNESEISHALSRKALADLRSRKSEVAWWKILLPCMGILIGFPIIYYLFLEHMEYIHSRDYVNATETVTNTTPHSQSHYH